MNLTKEQKQPKIINLSKPSSCSRKIPKKRRCGGKKTTMKKIPISKLPVPKCKKSVVNQL